MTKVEFREQFRNLCLGYDVDPKKKEDRLNIYYKSKLNRMNPIEFEELIVKAIEEIYVPKSHIPSVQQLLALRFTMGSNNNEDALEKLYQERAKMSPAEIMENLTESEQALLARCPICDNIGFVIMEKDGQTCSGMTCTCKYGKKKAQTALGQQSGCYTIYEFKGYKIYDPFNSSIINQEEL